MIILSSLTIDPDRSEATREVLVERAVEGLEELFNPDEYRVSVQARWIPVSLLVEKPSRIESVTPVGGMEKPGVFEVGLKGGHAGETVQIRMDVKLERLLPVARRRLQSGETLSAGDLVERWVELRANHPEFSTSGEELAGKTLRRTVAAGQPVRKRDVGEAFLVMAGDDVSLIFRHQGVEITLLGEARQNGGKGESITIYSEETRRRYTGRIIAPGVALWEMTE